MITQEKFSTLTELAQALRKDEKLYTLIYAENGTGKTRLSMEFKNLGKVMTQIDAPRPPKYKDSDYRTLLKPKKGDDSTKKLFYTVMTGEARNAATPSQNTYLVSHVGSWWPGGLDEREPLRRSGDTLYFNAFTEDLFYWDNDLEHDQQRVLKVNTDSRLLRNFQGLDLENKIGPHLSRYVDFDFRIDYTDSSISFYYKGKPDENVKISRGEENIFILCVFLTFAELALQKTEGYTNIKYIYIDDPISSLDEHNIIIIGNHLANIFRDNNLNSESGIRVIISTHHPLFFNVLCSELQSRINRYSLEESWTSNDYTLKLVEKDVPVFQHLSSLIELKHAAVTGKIYTYHFNLLRTILEKTASFLGYDKFDQCLRINNDPNASLHSRYANTLSHGKYSLYDPLEMGIENKRYFVEIVENLVNNFQFNKVLFPAAPATQQLKDNRHD